MRIVNDGLPIPIYNAICNDPYDAEGSDYTPSSLNTPVRIRALTLRHGADIATPASDRFWAFLGQAIHSVLERTEMGDGQHKEQRLHAEFASKKVSGQFDMYDTTTGTVHDYKCTSAWSFVFQRGGVKPEWEAQINILAALLRRNGHEPKAGKIIAILRDWMKNKAHEPDYPSLPAIEVNVPMWTDAETVAFIERRIAEHEAAKSLTDEQLPLCTSEERWQRPGTWAVMKDGRKSAVKVCDNEASAHDYLAANGLGIGQYHVVEREGKSVRCAEYCSVVDFCAFGRLMKNGGGE